MKQIPFMAIEGAEAGQNGKYPVVYGRGYGLPDMSGLCTLLPDCVQLMVKTVESLPEGRYAISVKGAGLARLRRGTALVPRPFIPWFSTAVMIDTDRSCPRGACRLSTPLTGGRKYGGRLDSFLGMPRFTPHPGNGVPVAAGFPVFIEPERREKTFTGTILAALPLRTPRSGKGVKKSGPSLETWLKREAGPGTGAERKIDQETGFRITYRIQGYLVMDLETSAAVDPGGSEEDAAPLSVPIDSGTVCLASKQFLEDCGRFLAACSVRPGGTEIVSAALEAGIPPLVLAAVLPRTEQADGIRLSQGRLLPAGDRGTRVITPIGKGILERLEQAGIEGVSFSAFRNPPFTMEIENLVRRGLVRKAGEYYWLPEQFLSAEKAIDRVICRTPDTGAGKIGEALGISKSRAQVLLREMYGKKGGFGEGVKR